MAKQKISAKAVTADVRSGLSEAEMLEKYSLSAKGLEVLFQKLIEHNIVTTAEISAYRQRPSKPGPSANEQRTSETLLFAAEPGIDPELADAVVEGVRAGRHDYDLMVRFRLGRDELQNLLEQLVRLGHLSSEEVEARRPRKIKQCPHCRGQVFDDADRCKQCGRTLIQPTSAVPSVRFGAKRTGLTAENISSDEGCAWDDYWKSWGSRGFFKAYFHTALQCLRSPSHFFSNLPVDFGYSAPIFFGAISGATPIAFYLVLFMFRTDRVAISDVGLLIFMIPIALLTGVIYAGASIFTSSLFIHGSLILVRGAHSGFQATFRSMSYSSLPWLFGVIPVVGWLVGNLWGLYLCGVGLRKTHDTSRAKAFSVVVIWFFFNVAVIAMLGGSKPWMHW